MVTPTTPRLVTGGFIDLSMLDFSMHVLLVVVLPFFLICCPLISFTNFIKSLSLLVTFLLNFRHGLSIDRSHVHLSIYKRSFYREFQQISMWWSRVLASPKFLPTDSDLFSSRLRRTDRPCQNKVIIYIYIYMIHIYAKNVNEMI